MVAAPRIQNVAVITILEGEASMEWLSEELREWGADDWDWQLEQISEVEFGVVFPSKESLRMVSKSASFTLPIHQLVISVKEATDVDRSFGSLVEAPVLLEDVPPEMRSVSGILVFSELVGKPHAVDEGSLCRQGPIRVSIWVRNPSLVHGFIEFIPGVKAYRIKVLVEGAPPARSTPPPPPPPPPAPVMVVPRTIVKPAVRVGRPSMRKNGRLWAPGFSVCTLIALPCLIVDTSKTLRMPWTLSLKRIPPLSSLRSRLSARTSPTTLARPRSRVLWIPPVDAEPQVVGPPNLANARLCARRRLGPKPRWRRRPRSPKLPMLISAGTSRLIWGKLVLVLMCLPRPSPAPSRRLCRRPARASVSWARGCLCSSVRSGVLRLETKLP